MISPVKTHYRSKVHQYRRITQFVYKVNMYEFEIIVNLIISAKLGPLIRDIWMFLNLVFLFVNTAN